MAKERKKGKKARHAAGIAARDTETTARPQKHKKSKQSRAVAIRTKVTRPATVVAAAGAAIVAGIVGFVRARR